MAARFCDQPATLSPVITAANPSNVPAELHAAIDIGTNSMHLVVARADADGGFDVLTTEKQMVRLGTGGGEMKQLAPDAIERGISALARMVAVARSMGVDDVNAVATSAVREATNKNEFLDRARDEIGIDVDVISGFEEARLIHLGVLQALPVFDQRLILADIGGGSTELLVGEGGAPIEARSMKLGAIRLTERFFPDPIPSTEQIDACRAYIRAALAPVAHELGGHQPEIAIGSSGTITTLAEMAAARRGETTRQMNGVSFTRAELDAILDDFVGASPEQRLKMDGLDEKRVDIILGGGLLLAEIFRAFDLEKMTISEYALREGVLLDRFGSTTRSGLARLADIRSSNVERLSRQLDPDPDHAANTARLATQLFDRTPALHGYGKPERELLEAAAMLHNVGLFISHSSHHKHSYYVIRNSEHLTGFTEHEIERIAVIARYHRKSRPAEKHAEFASLSKDDKRLVRVLAGLLRIAIGLDRGHRGTVQAVRAFVENRTLRIEPVASMADVDLDLELYAARERSGLLADALDVEVIVEAPAPRASSEHLSS